ncbi:MAG: hypothetical protein H0V61_07705 [Chitinophagales bacterium]|nr:hypothetical protein [Chitinophagales bacterium]
MRLKISGYEFLLALVTMAVPGLSFSQELLYSPPQRVTAGYAKVEILGKNSQGILVREIGRSDDQIAAYYDNLQIRWKKSTPHKEKNARVEQIVVYEDSLIIFYSVVLKNITLLKAFKTNSRLESRPLAVICDTINHSLVNATSPVHFEFTSDKNKILLYYEDAAFRSNKILKLTCFDAGLHRLWQTALRIKTMHEPNIIEAVLDDRGEACVVVGENTIKNFRNDFLYSELHVFKINSDGSEVNETIFEERDKFLGTCKARLDAQSGNILLAGLYADSPGAESDGVYFFLLKSDNSIVQKSFEPYSQEFLTELTGNNPPRRSDGFFDFKPKELIVKRDGGAILVAESETVSSESFTTSNYGAFGISSGFTVNYYHYDDIAVFSFQHDGKLEWKQILHKKQATEGDGGYYSSFVTMIAPTSLHFIYNDVSNGQTNVAGYTIDPSGNQQRSELLNADRKGVMLIPRSAKQISPNELIMPSLKRNYLQFVKISFNTP